MTNSEWLKLSDRMLADIIDAHWKKNAAKGEVRAVYKEMWETLCKLRDFVYEEIYLKGSL